MSSSAINQSVFSAKVSNIQNAADTSSIYSAGAWDFKNASAVTSVKIDASGNVGIGTASPSAKLEVNATGVGSVVYPIMASNQDTSATGTGAGISFVVDGVNDVVGGQIASVRTGSAYHQSALTFQTRDSNGAGLTERMRITASGDLLVGTTGLLGASAAGTVHIVGGSATGDNTPLCLRHPSSTAGYFWRTGPVSSAAYVVYNNNSVGMYMSYGATSWTAGSDERMKKNIKPLELGLEQIKALKPTRFDYKTDESEESARVGFIAQEVLPVLPHAVSVPEDSEQMMGVSATEMIPVLVKAIQELSAKVDAQAVEIEALKAKP